MYFRVIVAIVFIAQFQYISSYEYCRKDIQTEICGEKEHIYCHPEQLVDGELGKLYGVVPMTPLLKRRLIDFHNTARNKIACGHKVNEDIEFYKARRMRKVIWDDELQFLAETHVNECNEQKDKCHGTIRFMFTQQNLCVKTNNVTMAIFDVMDACLNEWFDERLHIGEQEQDSEALKGYHRFGVIVTEMVSRIGCGIALCQKEDLDQKHNYIMVCNYDGAYQPTIRLYDDVEGPNQDAADKCDYYDSKPSKKYPCLCTNNGKTYNPYGYWDEEPEHKEKEEKKKN